MFHAKDRPPLNLTAPEIAAYENWRRRERWERVLSYGLITIGLAALAIGVAYAISAAQKSGSSFETEAQKTIWEWGQNSPK